MLEWFYGGWEGLARTIILAVSAYLAFAAIIRISGKRALSHMSAFDFLLSVAIGSLLARTILAKDMALEEGVAAVAVLAIMHYGFAALSIHYPQMKNIIKSEPALLVYDGAYLTQAMHRNRITKDDVQGALRHHGVASIDEVESVVLERDGQFSVLIRKDSTRKDTLDPLLHQIQRDGSFLAS